MSWQPDSTQISYSFSFYRLHVIRLKSAHHLFTHQPGSMKSYFITLIGREVLHHRLISMQPTSSDNRQLLAISMITAITYWHFFTLEQLFNDNSFPCIAKLPLQHSSTQSTSSLTKNEIYTVNTKQNKNTTKIWFRNDRNQTQEP